LNQKLFISLFVSIPIFIGSFVSQENQVEATDLRTQNVSFNNENHSRINLATNNRNQTNPETATED
jgi:hypothetical protein